MRDQSPSRGDTAEEQLMALAPVLEAIARIPPNVRPGDLGVSVTVHLSVLTNAATLSAGLVALLHAAGAELDFWTDQAGRSAKRTRRTRY
jgi:hypothetical protein